MRLGSAGNTQGPALSIIEQYKGYTVLFDSDDDSDYTQRIAVKGDNQFFAESAEALLGLITIYEVFGDSWNQYSNARELIEQIFKREVKYYL